MNINKISIEDWQCAILPKLRTLSFYKSKVDNVTLLAYFFWNDDRIETKFFAIECAFLCAWKNWGMMPSVLVTNKTTVSMKNFALRYNVQLQVDDSLTGGLPTMSIDCVKNLHRRFNTEYVVIIQIDGIVVNPGIERFIGKYDYVGAPWPGHCHWRDWFPYPKYGVGNGGFCLRSKRICERAAKDYNMFWHYMPYNWFLCDDVFYCKTMPFLSRYWRQNFRFPSREEAIRFSVEHIPKDINLTKKPLGFHSQAGFDNYVNSFGLPLNEFSTDKTKSNPF